MARTDVTVPCGETAHVEAEGIPVAVVVLRDLADEKRVVTAVIFAPWAALEVGQRTGQTWGRLALYPVHRRIATWSRAGESPCHGLLFGAQDVDAERSPTEQIVCAGSPRDANQDEWRIDRDRG